ncbi:MAG: thiamine pyrophosphate-dependent enzyme, partial [Opitutales bacterium]
TKLGLTVKDSQMREPLFEFSGACSGCGETPYVKLLTQLFGDRLLIANATGCSSIYGGNLPTTPYGTDDCGRGPAWSNSLFEDNAEFGFGIRLAVDKKAEIARALVTQLAGDIGDNTATEILTAPQTNEAEIALQRERVAGLRERLRTSQSPAAQALLPIVDYLVVKSVWCLGGDGWAYDIGFGGLDHVIASGRNINILVLDTEVYSNTGGQASKSTPIGAVAKFAAQGKPTLKKDIAGYAVSYGNVYVAQIAYGAKDNQTVQAMAEAESFPGPSLVLAYSPCIAHGYNLNFGPDQQKKAVSCGHWPLFRHDPRRVADDLPPLKLDSSAPQLSVRNYAENEVRYRMLMTTAPEQSEMLFAAAQSAIADRWKRLSALAASDEE